MADDGLEEEKRGKRSLKITFASAVRARELNWLSPTSLRGLPCWFLLADLDFELCQDTSGLWAASAKCMMVKGKLAHQ